MTIIACFSIVPDAEQKSHVPWHNVLALQSTSPVWLVMEISEIWQRVYRSFPRLSKLSAGLLIKRFTRIKKKPFEGKIVWKSNSCGMEALFSNVLPLSDFQI